MKKLSSVFALLILAISFSISTPSRAVDAQPEETPAPSLSGDKGGVVSSGYENDYFFICLRDGLISNEGNYVKIAQYWGEHCDQDAFSVSVENCVLETLQNQQCLLEAAYVGCREKISSADAK